VLLQPRRWAAVSTACCSTLLTGTKRMVGRWIASQIASASLPSFLPLLRYGATNRGATMRTVCPSAWKRRAHSCLEAERRYEQYKRGEVQAIPGDEVFARIRSRLRQG